MQRGAQLAIDQINARGGVHGRRLTLRLADDSASEDAAVRAAQALYDAPGVVAVLGHLTSDASIVAAQVYGGGTRPVTMISPSASSPDLSGITPYAFRICPSDSSSRAPLQRSFPTRSSPATRHRSLPLNPRPGPRPSRFWFR